MKYFSSVLLTLTFFFSQAQDGKFSRPDLSGDLMVDIGINKWSSMPDSLSGKNSASKSVGIYYTKRYNISNKLSFYTGIGFGLEKTGFDNDVSLIDTAEYLFEIPFTQIDKNKLAITYLDIPFDIRFHPNDTEDGEGFFIGVGGIIGVKLNAHTKWKYGNGSNTTVQKISGQFNLETFRYGYQVRLGFKGVHLFYKGYLNDTFKSSVGNANPTMSTFGINLTGF